MTTAATAAAIKRTSRATVSVSGAVNQTLTLSLALAINVSMATRIRKRGAPAECLLRFLSLFICSFDRLSPDLNNRKSNFRQFCLVSHFSLENSGFDKNRH